MSIRYCPTEEMVADFFTKPLQGSLFQCLHSIIMNLDPSAQGALDPRSVLGQSDREGSVKQNLPLRNRPKGQGGDSSPGNRPNDQREGHLKDRLSVNHETGYDIKNSKGLFKSRSKVCSKNTCAVPTYKDVLVGATDRKGNDGHNNIKKGTIGCPGRFRSTADAVDPKN